MHKSKPNPKAAAVVCPLRVTAADRGGVRIEDPKTQQSWLLANDDTRFFANAITHQRKIAEKQCAERNRAEAMRRRQAFLKA